ncbi:MAG: hypothetical protein L6R28_14690 [Planctomycetes bacterium]|nr:hypothetical protein [Planctomycetota bacterium]
MDTKGKDWAAADRLANGSILASMAGLVCAACFILYTVGAFWQPGAGSAGDTAPAAVILATYWGTVALALAGLVAGLLSLRHARDGNTGATLGTLLNGVLLLALGVLFLQLF